MLSSFVRTILPLPGSLTMPTILTCPCHLLVLRNTYIFPTETLSLSLVTLSPTLSLVTLSLTLSLVILSPTLSTVHLSQPAQHLPPQIRPLPRQSATAATESLKKRQKVLEKFEAVNSNNIIININFKNIIIFPFSLLKASFFLFSGRHRQHSIATAGAA